VISVYLPERVREHVRMVAAEPPHHPEPHPDEPFAPVYDYRPLDGYVVSAWLPRGHAVVPRYPDPLVFGQPGARQGLEQDGAGMFRRCHPCGVSWRGEAACWCCGRTTIHDYGSDYVAPPFGSLCQRCLRPRHDGENCA
jgi:hypothetical protein